MLTQTPKGLAEIKAVFGDANDPNFESKYLQTFDLPYPLLYDGKTVMHARCHRLIVDNFLQTFQQIKDRGLTGQVKNYGGIYRVRPKQGLSDPSTHSWGIAIDLEPARYPLGSKNRFSGDVVRIFEDAGFFYGGDFSGRLDPMHFQFCTGY